jgi:hypothetical protein
MLSNFLIGGPNQSHNVNFKEPLSKEKEGQTNLFTSAPSIPFLKIFQKPKFKRTSNRSLLFAVLKRQIEGSADNGNHSPSLKLFLSGSFLKP